MFRLLIFLAALALAALGCTSSLGGQTATADTSQVAKSPLSDGDSTADPVAETTELAVTASSDAAQPESERDAPATLLLPDPQRWVVVDDWSDFSPATSSRDDVASLQLDVAPLDEDGVPQLGRRISLGYRLGPVEDFDRQWGDASSMGEPVDFVVDDGRGRSLHNPQAGFATAQIWHNGTFVSIQTQDPDADLTELAKSMAKVDDVTWAAARAGAEGQRLVAVEAAMRTVEPVAPPGEPMPHWVLPEPWRLQLVTDKTIWTPEQHAQAAGFAAASRSPNAIAAASRESASWRYGFADTADGAARQFVPQVAIYVSVYAEPPDDFYPTNYDTIAALGLEGVISAVVGSPSPSVVVELGRGEVRVFVQTRNFSEDGVREFLQAAEFASDDPLDGFVVSDSRFQPIALAQPGQRGPNWHAAWEDPLGGRDAAISVWRLSVPELRMWLFNRGGLTVPDDVWETVAAGGVVDFGDNATYDVSAGLLMTMRGIEPDDLVPIELDDWINLVDTMNTDPIRPR